MMICSTKRQHQGPEDGFGTIAESFQGASNFFALPEMSFLLF
jgi:hypothetical protein